MHGSIIGGRFAGEITTSEGVYHVEKSEVYFREPQKFHSVIYKDSDIDTEPHRCTLCRVLTQIDMNIEGM